MRIPGGLDENFRFLVLEVRKQVEETQSFLARPGQALLDAINGRDDYIDSLRSLLEEKSYAFLMGQGHDRPTANLIRSLNTIVTNLERIADFAVNIVNQMEYLSDDAFIRRFNFDPFFEETYAGLDRIVEAVTHQDLSLAFRICQSEFCLDDLYKQNLDRILSDLRLGQNTGDLVTSLFILRYLERIGDSLLNVGEAAIFAALGERLKIHQFQALREHLAQAGAELGVPEVEFSSIWGTRSGCRIGQVEDKSGEGRTQRAIFKEGKVNKIAAERRNIEHWQELMPGLPPKVVGYQQSGSNASLLLEYLGGCTFQDVVVNSDQDILENALFLVTETLGTIWRATLKHQPVNASFIPQIIYRMDDVYRVHPRFERAGIQIGKLSLAPLDDLLAQADEIGRELDAPFSVFIHGDFNVNNIIYHHTEQRVHFIDLYRSVDSDYVQDVSIFLASNFRLPVKRSPLRQRINWVIREFLRFASAFAHDSQDATFAPRLTLGLARSFFTSTRFELNQEFAKSMFLRSVYLMESLLRHQGKPWPEFKLPEEVLIY